jgi:hypothetical protein
VGLDTERPNEAPNGTKKKVDMLNMVRRIRRRCASGPWEVTGGCRGAHRRWICLMEGRSLAGGGSEMTVSLLPS